MVGLHQLGRRRSATAPLLGRGRPSWLYGARRHPSRGERGTHHPLGSSTASSLDASPRGRRGTSRSTPPTAGGASTHPQEARDPADTPSGLRHNGSSVRRLTECPAFPEARAKEACCRPTATDPRGGRLNLQDPLSLVRRAGSPSLVKPAGDRRDATSHSPATGQCPCGAKRRKEKVC